MQQLAPYVRNVLQLLLHNEFEETVFVVSQCVANYHWERDNTNIWNCMPPACPKEVMFARIVEVVAHWIRWKIGSLDRFISRSTISTAQPEIRKRLASAAYQSPWQEVFVEFIHAVVCELLDADAGCLGSVLGGFLMKYYTRDDLLCLCEQPASLLSVLSETLWEVLAKVGRVALELYQEVGTQGFDPKSQLMPFFCNFTIDTHSGEWEVHETNRDPVFTSANFRVRLIDTLGGVIQLLRRLEVTFTGCAGHDVALAVDFEGVKLCRHGALCLVQLTISDDPTLVYVLDVHALGKKVFTLESPMGYSMKKILEDQSICKVWFDPRNDVDALYHQFDIMPRGIFDLQLAEVADRRSRGLIVNYVQGLHRCLAQCNALQPEQKTFAERINDLGKSLYEPQFGGDYSVFQKRPLNPIILCYAAHDSRYMLELYDQYRSAISDCWVQRVKKAAAERGRWCLRDYVVPGSEAPDF